MSAVLNRFLTRSRLRSRWPIAISCRSDVWFAFGVSGLWLALYNITFWEHTAQAMWRPSFSAIAFLPSLAVLVLGVQALIHGPAYWERYPAAFERFKPACRSNELHTCSEQQLVNAYDNTIAHTDHVLSRQIEILRSAAESVDSFLLYVSDHGESLGENSIYLHGMPYSLAPRVQKHVPMLIWASDGYVARMHLDIQCLRRRSSESISHDNLYHTLLGAAEVHDAMYQPGLDILSECRK